MLYFTKHSTVHHGETFFTLVSNVQNILLQKSYGSDATLQT